MRVAAAPGRGRFGATVVCVAVLHGLVLWGVQRSLQPLRFRPLETLPPLSAKLIAAPPPVAPPVAQPAPALRPAGPPTPTRKPAQSLKPAARRAPPAKPQPVSLPAPPVEVPPAPQPLSEPVMDGAAEGASATATAAAQSSAPAGAPAAAPPSRDAQCPGNPPPPYPALSRRLGESGRVTVRALIGADGQVRETHLQGSSGHRRLDDAALQAVRRWRCQPVVRDGVPQTEWRNAPVDFILR